MGIKHGMSRFSLTVLTLLFQIMLFLGAGLVKKLNFQVKHQFNEVPVRACTSCLAEAIENRKITEEMEIKIPTVTFSVAKTQIND